MWRVSSRIRARWLTAESTSPRASAPSARTVKVPGPAAPSATKFPFTRISIESSSSSKWRKKRHVVPGASRREPVTLGDTGPLEHLPVHLQVTLLVGELEQRALLQLVERRVGGGGRDVVGGRQLGIVVVGELIDGPLEILRAHGLVVQRILRDAGTLGHVPLALAGLHGDVALPGETRRVAETARVLEGESLARHPCSPLRARPALHRVRLPAHEPALFEDRRIHAAPWPATAQHQRDLLTDAPLAHGVESR